MRRVLSVLLYQLLSVGLASSMKVDFDGSICKADLSLCHVTIRVMYLGMKKIGKCKELERMGGGRGVAHWCDRG